MCAGRTGLAHGCRPGATLARGGAWRARLQSTWNGLVRDPSPLLYTYGKGAVHEQGTISTCLGQQAPIKAQWACVIAHLALVGAFVV